MNPTVTGVGGRTDGGLRSPGSRALQPQSGASSIRGRGLSLRLACAVGLLTCPAAAQTAGSGKAFQARVVEMTATTQRVAVPANRSVIVETTVEVARADAVNSNVADVSVVSPTHLLLTGKNYGQTNVVLWDAGHQQYVLEVNVEIDLRQLNEVLHGVDPQADVQAQSLFGNIVLTGTVSSGERAQRMVELAGLYLPRNEAGTTITNVQNHVTVAGEQQVLLRCAVAEVNRSAMRELGINGFLAGENVRDAFLINQIGPLNPINIGAAGSALQSLNLMMGWDETLGLRFPGLHPI